ncbi:MAG: hypothetical protein K2M73_05815 [Lachnospiraceae bacterium]|nr:hypothetical protein [Lachnospiraceae bacterium]
MNCKEFNKNIDSFLKEKIDEDLLEDFIEHYKMCKSCNEELEIYFLAHKIFDNSEDLGENVNEKYNLKESLVNFIKEKEDIVYRNYKRDFIFKMMFLIGDGMSIGLAAYFIYILVTL